MKRIIFIDVESPEGHVSLNKSMLLNLSKLSNTEVTCVFREGYLFNEVDDFNFRLKTLPSWLYLKRDLGAFFNRFMMLVRLYYLKWFIGLKSYDIVFFSCFDEIVYFFAFIKQKAYLLNNINVSGLNHKLKVYFYKIISKNNVQVVFEDYIKKFLTETIGICDVIVLKHGLPERINLKDNDVSSICLPQDLLNIVIEKRFLFIPSATSTDSIFLDSIFSSLELEQFLNINNLYIVVKGNRLTSKCNRIIIVNRYLTDIEYKYLFKSCFGVIISYPQDFKYRVSNVFYECVINNKICFLSNIAALRVYEPFIVRPYFFNSIQELISCVQNELTVNTNQVNYLNLSSFSINIDCVEKYLSKKIH